MPLFHRVQLVAAIGVALLASAPTRAGDRQPQIPELKVEKFRLQNGLDVLLLEDHTSPSVAVNIWYNVGSKNESRGHTGYAHLIEHLMFLGSEHFDHRFRVPLEKLGALVNATTNIDRTNYFETMPSNGLELALWLESDRMGYLLPALTQAKLDNERNVVKNERRQRIDDVPYVQSTETMLAILTPADQPDHHNVAGSMADLSAASLADISDFVRAYYSPNNASLAIVGDFKTPEVKKWVEKYFGPLRAGPKVRKLAPNRLMIERSRFIARTERVSEARTQFSWNTVESGHDDEAALHILAAVLGQLSRQNRLYRALVAEKQVAVQVSAASNHTQIGGSFVVTLSARPGHSLDELVKLADVQIERLKQNGPTEDEVAKAQNASESNLITGLQSATQLADLLNANNVTYGSPTAYVGRFKKLFAVTPADVKRIANKHLTGGRVRLDINPGDPAHSSGGAVADRRPARTTPPKTPRSIQTVPNQAESDNGPAGAGALASAITPVDRLDRSKPPEVGPNPKFTPPPIVRRKLSNGLEVMVVERHHAPTLTLRLICRGGENVAPPGKEGLAALTAHLLTEGTQSRNATNIAGELSAIGATLSTNANLELSGLALSTLSRHEAKAIALFADMLVHPSFPENDLVRIRAQRIAVLARRRDSAPGIASVVFRKLLFGSGHPYGRSETIASVKGLSRDDAVRFYKQVFLPNNAALIVAGDTRADAITAKLEQALGGWQPGEPAHASYPDPPPPKATTVYLVDKPGAAQSHLTVGQVGVGRDTPDYFALLILNSVLGGQASGRLSLNLREEKGFSYGAQSSFSFRQGPGPFLASTAVETAVTRAALSELLKELKDISGSRPVTAEELAFAKGRLKSALPSRFDTARGQTTALNEMFLFRLPDDYFTSYESRIESVGLEAVARAAQKYIDHDHLTILVVGDRKVIEPKLKEMPFAQVIHVLDADGDPLTEVGSGAGGPPRLLPSTGRSD
jgi:zinc protease